MAEDLVRIGDKIVSLRKIQETVKKILNMRSSGLSQQEVAKELGIDRTFISRLESMGEIRKGKKVAVFGFPLQNKEEITAIAQSKGVDFVWLMSEKERWELVKGKSALDFFNEVMELIAILQKYEIVVIIASKRWLKIAEALLNNEVVFLELGASPIKEDHFLDPKTFEETMDRIILQQEMK